jgi:hydroxymethylpyrimidine/phosphomethylpyrimidine kinase
VLSIAGLDPSGGAGLSADLRSIHAAGAWGCAVCACLTVQSTAGLVAVHPVEPSLVLAQAREVMTQERVLVVKTGALATVDNVHAVLRILRQHRPPQVVVDPVMVATRAASGARLLDGQARDSMLELVAEATIVTPNTNEAEQLLDSRIRDQKDLREAARQLVARGARAALIKGGHLDTPRAVDMLAVGHEVVPLYARKLDLAPFHGGGCVLASLIAGRMALQPGMVSGAGIEQAVRWAKRRLGRSLRQATRVGEGLLVLPV